MFINKHYAINLFYVEARDLKDDGKLSEISFDDIEHALHRACEAGTEEIHNKLKSFNMSVFRSGIQYAGTEWESDLCKLILSFK